MTTDPEIETAWRDHRAYLINLAYQILGDIGEAEDVAQEAYLRLAATAGVDDARAWLTVVTGRICLDQLRSARARRELTDESRLDAAVAVESDPADRVTLDDEVRAALWEVLRRLTPAERVSFVLHDVFGMPFAAIAETVGRPAGTCRQLARRARAKFTSAPPRLADVSAAEHRAVAAKFIAACAGDDIGALTALLDPTVWGVGTLVGSPGAQLVNRGQTEVAANLLRYLGSHATLVSAGAGAPVILAFRDRALFAVVRLTVRGGLITTIEASVGPL